MNILPSIDKNRRGFKFSNPLSGVIYNNNNYLKQCQYDPDPERIIIHRRKTSHNNMQSFVQQNQIKRKQSKNISSRECFYKTNNQRMSFSVVNTSYSKAEAQMTKTQKADKNVYRFPDIEIKIIDEISSYKDFVQKKLKVNLAHYFGMFFKKSLAGSITQDVIEVVQKYLQILVDKKKLDTPVEMKDYPSQYFTLKSKRAFIQRIQELQNKKNFKPIQQMIKFYCVPAKEFRQSCFRDIIHMISQSLYQKFNLSKERDYVLLDQNGKLIEEICAIKFSTTQLLITNRVNHQRSYNQYKNIIQSNLQNFKKISFSQGLKKSFRGIIAAGKFDQSPSHHDRDIIQARNKRIFAQSKLQKHRKSDKSLQKFDPAKTTNNFQSKSKEKHATHRKSKSSLTKAQTIQQISQIKIRTVSARKRDQAYEKAFERLRNLNSFYDITFNHLNQKQILMIVLKRQSELFKNKSIEQADAILKAFKINPKALSITWQQFRLINQVSNCKGENEDIVDFVGRYLPFNEYGEMDKEGLSKTLKFILNEVDGEQVVLDIIWSWLYKNNLIQNDGVLVRTTLESWYEKNKMAFVIMISLIFGTNQMSWIDMAYQVLV